MPPTIEPMIPRDSLASFYARRHLAIDNGVTEIFYLPTGAPPREIRFLEVNSMIAETTPLEPIDFGVDSGSNNAHSLYVLDVTPSQWDDIQSGHLHLPAGWSLQGSQPFHRENAQ